MKFFFALLFLFFISTSFAETSLKTACQIKPNSCQKVSEVLRTRKQLCEIKLLANDCNHFKKENPTESWKYIGCELEDICRQDQFTWGEGISACVTGALALPIAIYEQIKIQDDLIKDCDKSLACKRQWASAQPTTQNLTDVDLKKKNMAAYLWTKKTEFDPIRARMYASGQIKKEDYYQQMQWSLEAQKKFPNVKPGDALTLSSMWTIVTDKIDREFAEVRCFIPTEKIRFTCEVVSNLVGGVAIEKAFAGALAKRELKSAAKSAVAAERRMGARLARIAESSEPKKLFEKEFGKSIQTSVEENETWLKRVNNPTANQNTVTFENTMFKNMNDVIFKEEAFPTALTNLNQSMNLQKLRELEQEIQKTHPEFKFYAYSNFKSLKLTYDEIPGLNLSSQIRAAAEETQKDYTEYLLKNKLVRASDEPAKWFKTSIGPTDDLANLAVRYGRQEGKFFVDATDPAFVAWAQKSLSKAQELRKELLTTFRETKLVTTADQATGNFDREVFDILRKNKASRDVAKQSLEQKFGVQSINDQSFEKLRTYFEHVDNLSPGLQGVDRTIATLAEAPHGGISVDMIGLGADHLQQTSAAALGQSKNLTEFLARARQGEQALTQEVRERTLQMETKFKEVTGDPNAKFSCPGDGCKGFLPGRELTESETNRFFDLVTQSGEQGRLRFSQVRGSPREFQEAIVKEGDQVEKDLRKALSGTRDTRNLNGLNFSVSIRSAKPGEGVANLHISEANNLKLTTTQKKAIQAEFDRLVKSPKSGYQFIAPEK